MLVMLQWLGLDISTASAVTFLFRVINYWSIIVLGFVLYFSSRNGNRSTKEQFRYAECVYKNP